MTGIINSSPCMTSTSSMICFGSFDPIIIKFSTFMPRAITHQNIQSIVESDDEGWILITQKRSRKKNISNSKSILKRVRMVKELSHAPRMANQKKTKFTKLRKTFPLFKMKGILQKAR